MKYLSRMSRKNIQSLANINLSSLQRYYEYVWRSGGGPLRIELPEILIRDLYLRRRCIRQEIRCRAIDSLSDWQKLENFSSSRETRTTRYRSVNRASSEPIDHRERWYSIAKFSTDLPRRGAERKEKREDRRSHSEGRHRHHRQSGTVNRTVTRRIAANDNMYNDGTFSPQCVGINKLTIISSSIRWE